MSWYEALASALLSAGLTSGLLALLAKRYVLSRIELQKYRAEKEIDLLAEKRGWLLSNRLKVYPELLELCHKAKVLAEDSLRFGSVPAWKVEEFSGITARLTERLFNVRLLVASAAWPLLHKTKHQCQNLLIYLEILSRTSSDQNEESLVELVRPRAADAATSLAKNLDKLDAVFRSEVAEIAGTAP